jgi:hypothetical protein
LQANGPSTVNVMLRQKRELYGVKVLSTDMRGNWQLFEGALVEEVGGAGLGVTVTGVD